MPFPKLSPLQSRLAASLVASVLALLLYLTLTSSHFAYALDVYSIQPEDHNHERLLTEHMLAEGLHEDTETIDGLEAELGYEPSFLGIDRGIIGRAATRAAPDEIPNNGKVTSNVELGSTMNFVFTNQSVFASLSSTTNGLPPSEKLHTRRGTAIDVELERQRENTDEFDEEPPEEGKTDQVRLVRRQNGGKTVYITLNTCLQPRPVNGTGASPPADQLELYVSQSNTSPGPGTQDTVKILAEHGFANYTLQATGPVYVGLHAPNSTTHTGPYSAQLGGSIDAPYHAYVKDHADMFFIDSDTTSALLATKNLTLQTNGSSYDEWMALDPPYVIFASMWNSSAIVGVEHSYCGLEMASQIAGTKNGERTNAVQTRMTDKTLGPFPKQQFYFNGLTPDAIYYGNLALPANSTASAVGGGGRVFRTMDFTTKSVGNCVVVFNLTFCDTVAYAVPGNPTTFPNVTALADFYDNFAQQQYGNFSNVLAQIPCEIDSVGQYSLARNCTDCASAYKDWLCSVTIPRCMDYSATDSWLQPRNIAQSYPNGTNGPPPDPALLEAGHNLLFLNSSRSPIIDQTVQPGPYKEILPCDDLCYNLVQSCPAAIGFGCPQPGMIGFNSSYGRRPSSDQGGNITCNYPGAAYQLSSGHSSAPLAWTIISALTLCLLLV